MFDMSAMNFKRPVAIKSKLVLQQAVLQSHLVVKQIPLSLITA